MGNLELSKIAKEFEVKDYLKIVLGHGGEQYIFRFENNYGASVIRSVFSYGYSDDLYELAVLTFYDDGILDYKVCTETEISEDVIGYLNTDEVRNYLLHISKLKRYKYDMHNNTIIKKY